MSYASCILIGQYVATIINMPTYKNKLKDINKTALNMPILTKWHAAIARIFFCVFESGCMNRIPY